MKRAFAIFAILVTLFAMVFAQGSSSTTVEVNKEQLQQQVVATATPVEIVSEVIPTVTPQVVVATVTPLVTVIATTEPTVVAVSTVEATTQPVVVQAVVSGASSLSNFLALW